LLEDLVDDEPIGALGKRRHHTEPHSGRRCLGQELADLRGKLGEVPTRRQVPVTRDADPNAEGNSALERSLRLGHSPGSLNGSGLRVNEAEVATRRAALPHLRFYLPTGAKR
jgi:hypothetical protein